MDKVHALVEEHSHLRHSMGGEDQNDRESIRLGRLELLHIPALDLLDQFHDDTCRLPVYCTAGGICSLSFIGEIDIATLVRP